MSSDEYERGLAVRRSVLGEEYVAQSLGKQSPFDDPIMEFATEAYWAKVWGRGKVPRRDLSIAVIAMLIALDRREDLALHLRAGIRNGLKIEEIREILLISAVYCGAPAAHRAFHIAHECLANEVRAFNKANETADRN